MTLTAYIDQSPRVLGLDMSLTATGWGVISKGKVIDSGVIQSKQTGLDRVVEITGVVCSLVDFHGVDLVAIEGYSFASKGDAVTKLAELGGVLRYRLYGKGVDYVEISPGTWRKTVLGKGNLAKDQVRLAAYKKYGFEIEDHNALEAALVGVCAYIQHGERVAAL